VQIFQAILRVMGIDKWISPGQEIGLRRELPSATILQRAGKTERDPESPRTREPGVVVKRKTWFKSDRSDW